jgi:hypothetical protein
MTAKVAITPRQENVIASIQSNTGNIDAANTRQIERLTTKRADNTVPTILTSDQVRKSRREAL